MKSNRIAKSAALLGLSLSLCMGVYAGDEGKAKKGVPWKAEGMAPLHAMAHFVSRDADDSRSYAWKLNLYAPKVTWEACGEGPAVKDPRRMHLESWHVKSEVQMVELKLNMGYSAASQIGDEAQNRIVDLKGKRLSMAEAKKRLDDDTPVLLAVNGKMPEAFYTQCLKEDTLVVLIGLPSPREFNLLPTSKIANK